MVGLLRICQHPPEAILEHSIAKGVGLHYEPTCHVDYILHFCQPHLHSTSLAAEQNQQISNSVGTVREEGTLTDPGLKAIAQLGVIRARYKQVQLVD